MYDVVIVGAGPAGLTAALYTTRRKLSTLVLSKDIGGQAATTTVIENYPGVGSVDGFELMQQFKQQAELYGAEFQVASVDGITRQDDGQFVVHYNGQAVEAASVILAFGLTPRSLGVPGEQSLTGHGVSYSTAGAVSAVTGKTAVVIGGGNSAIEAVNILSGVAKKVYLIHRRKDFRAEPILVDAMHQRSNVEKVLEAHVTAIQGDDHVTSVTVQQLTDKREWNLPVDAVFVHAGFMSQTGFVKDVVELNPKHEIVVQTDCSTSTPGLFAAGDITTVNYKQVVISAGEGCKAALACYAYLAKQRGLTVAQDQDWVVTSGKHIIRT